MLARYGFNICHRIQFPFIQFSRGVIRSIDSMDRQLRPAFSFVPLLPTAEFLRFRRCSTNLLNCKLIKYTCLNIHVNILIIFRLVLLRKLLLEYNTEICTWLMKFNQMKNASKTELDFLYTMYTWNCVCKFIQRV